MSFYSTLPWVAWKTARFEMRCVLRGLRCGDAEVWDAEMRRFEMRIPQVAGQLETLRPIIQLFAFKKTKQHTQRKSCVRLRVEEFCWTWTSVVSSYIFIFIRIYVHIIYVTVFGKHCECNAQKCTHLKRLPSLASHSLLLSHCVLTQHEGHKKSQDHLADSGSRTDDTRHFRTCVCPVC